MCTFITSCNRHSCLNVTKAMSRCQQYAWVYRMLSLSQLWSRFLCMHTSHNAIHYQLAVGATKQSIQSINYSIHSALIRNGNVLNKLIPWAVNRPDYFDWINIAILFTWSNHAHFQSSMNYTYNIIWRSFIVFLYLLGHCVVVLQNESYKIVNNRSTPQLVVKCMSC